MDKLFMSQHFTFADTSQPGVIPFNAIYPFPSQVNKAVKMISKIPPKNGNVFTPGSVITIVIPAQGYIDGLKTTLAFDAVMYPQVSGTSTNPLLNYNDGVTLFQNGIASIFQRVRWLYGSTTGEDIQEQDQWTRMITEHTATNQQGVLDNMTITDGVGGYVPDFDGDGSRVGFCRTRSKYIQGNDWTDADPNASVVVPPVGSPSDWFGGSGFGIVPGGSDIPGGIFPPDSRQSAKASVRRYQIPLPLGLFSQGKLIPAKWMASALTLELTLGQPERCMYTPVLATAAPTSAVIDSVAQTGTAVLAPITTPSYAIGNVSLIPVVLEFDSTYDEAFYEGLKMGGCPIHYSSVNTTRFTCQSNNIMTPIPEKGRSVKAVFAVQYRPQPSFTSDYGAFFMDTSSTGGTLQQFQWRIANRLYPAQPVLTASSGSSKCNGAVEAYVEHAKALNMLHQYTLSPNVNVKNWGLQSGSLTSGGAVILHEHDYKYSLRRFFSTNIPQLVEVNKQINAFCGTLPSQCFVMSVNLETSNGAEISGLNSEEQSDIYLEARWNATQCLGTESPLGFPGLMVFTYSDRVIVLKENNVGVIIQ